MITMKITGTADTIGMIRDIGPVVEKIAADQIDKVSTRAHRAVRSVLTSHISGMDEEFVGPMPKGSEGKPPHARTGALAVSIYKDKTGPLTVRIGTPLDYGRMLEYGTRNMKRRPWLVKTVMKYRKQFFSGMNARIRQAVTKMGVQGAKVKFGK